MRAFVDRSASSMSAQSARSSASGISYAVLNGDVGDFFRLMKHVKPVMGDLALQLPQIVVVGQESSGKSSVLESLAMLPLFPRDEHICTRMPIHLKLRHAADGDCELMPSAPVVPEIQMRLLFSDGRDPVESTMHFSPQQAAQCMRSWMDDIVASEADGEGGSQPRGVVDHVLEIRISSPQVPNLNLIDLPGIVAGRLLDEPDDMMQQTRALVETYLVQPHTLVLAVVPAFERVRNSQAFQLVQQFGLTDRTIGVLTMVDRAMDAANPNGPLAEVMGRLDGTSRDTVQLKQGYVAVMNRDTRVTPEHSLEEFKTREIEWLESNLPGYVAEDKASSFALVQKLEQMLAEHVRLVWVPQMLKRVMGERTEVFKKLSEMGPSPQEAVDCFVEGSQQRPTAERQALVFRFVETVLPKILESMDGLVWRITESVEEAFEEAKPVNKLLLTTATKCQFASINMATKVLQEAERKFLRSHSQAIVDSVFVYLISMVKSQVIAAVSAGCNLGQRRPFDPENPLVYFDKFYLFVALALWEQLQQLDKLEPLSQRILEEFSSVQTIPVQNVSAMDDLMFSIQTMGIGAQLSEIEQHLLSEGCKTVPRGPIFSPRIPSEQRKTNCEQSSANTGFPPMSSSLFGPPPNSSENAPSSTLGGFGSAVRSTVASSSSARGLSFGSSARSTSTISFGSSAAANISPASRSMFGVSSVARPTPSSSSRFGSTAFAHAPPAFETGQATQSSSGFAHRLASALSSQVALPLVLALSDPDALQERLAQYCNDNPTVDGQSLHLFGDKDPEERKQLEKMIGKLEKVQESLQSMEHEPLLS